MRCFMPSFLVSNPPDDAAECTAYIKRPSEPELDQPAHCWESGRQSISIRPLWKAWGRKLHVEKAALERNHHGVRAVAGAELRKNAFEVALYRVLGDA